MGSPRSSMGTLPMKEEMRSGASTGEEAGFPCRVQAEDNSFRVIAELPEVSEEKIQVDLDEYVLVISAEAGGRRRYRMRIPLPFETSLGTKKFSRGVLDVTLERSGP